MKRRWGLAGAVWASWRPRTGVTSRCMVHSAVRLVARWGAWRLSSADVVLQLAVGKGTVGSWVAVVGPPARDDCWRGGGGGGGSGVPSAARCGASRATRAVRLVTRPKGVDPSVDAPPQLATAATGGGSPRTAPEIAARREVKPMPMTRRPGAEADVGGVGTVTRADSRDLDDVDECADGEEATTFPSEAAAAAAHSARSAHCSCRARIDAKKVTVRRKRKPVTKAAVRQNHRTPGRSTRAATAKATMLVTDVRRMAGPAWDMAQGRRRPRGREELVSRKCVMTITTSSTPTPTATKMTIMVRSLKGTWAKDAAPMPASAARATVTPAPRPRVRRHLSEPPRRGVTKATMATSATNTKGTDARTLTAISSSMDRSATPVISKREQCSQECGGGAGAVDADADGGSLAEGAPPCAGLPLTRLRKAASHL
mmetsp:Transcript_19482/g.52439  ORF Transcript_19482/g.52439 Transcript_19482/m.52439 type:complete len:428 (+) Transcript_19482:2160-3443(+)